MALAHMTDDFDSDGSERSAAARFFGIIADPRAYGALLYMVLALATGIFYFTWVVTGLSLSLGLMVLIIGIPLALLFLGSVRVLSTLEGYLTRGLLGAHIPEREAVELDPEANRFFAFAKGLVSDGRTWTSMVYMVLQLVLGTIYFTFVVTSLSVSFAFIAAPIAQMFGGEYITIEMGAEELANLPAWLTWAETAQYSPMASIVLVPIGILLFFLTLHIARGIGYAHGRMAEKLLVRN